MVSEVIWHTLCRYLMCTVLSSCRVACKLSIDMSHMYFLALWNLCYYSISLLLPHCMECRRNLAMRIPSITVQQWLMISTWNFGSKWPHWSEIANFLSVFAHSTSAVTPTEKSSINTNRKSTTHFPMSPRWTSYVVPKPPKGGSKMQSVQYLNNKLR